MKIVLNVVSTSKLSNFGLPLYSVLVYSFYCDILKKYFFVLSSCDFYRLKTKDPENYARLNPPGKIN